MEPIVECIPNFSEGRREEIIKEIANCIESVKGVKLLDYLPDKSHNRTVFTFVGSPDAVLKAAFESAKKAVELIDMRKHTGEHPRMGAVDVIPFVPIKDISIEECIKLSRKLGKKIADELSMPVFLYEESATKPERKNLANIRKGQFEGMSEKLKDPDWLPDFGKAKPHPTAGVVAIGARRPLIAYNVNLDTSDVDIAKKIAKIIRERNGGLKSVKAIGVMLEDKNIAQVSINMTDYETAPLYRVFELIKIEARRYGVNILGSEIIGLTPMEALIDSVIYYLQLNEFDKEKQILENYLL